MSAMPERIHDLSALKPLPDLPQLQVYLHPGHLFFTTQPTLVTTILGPCVSVCLFDEESGTAGVNHYLLPDHFGSASPRFGDVANEMLLAKFTESGIPTHALKAKVFGGAMMRMVNSDLAERNIRAAHSFLKQAGIAVTGGDVGGDRGRKLHFRTTDGAAWIRLL
jgi:chemotaxis protein CheD